nr:hypothetical protein [Tanacetum cinerariifolium]
MAKKDDFLLSSISVMYVLTTPMPEDGGDNPTVEQVKIRAKRDNDNFDTLEAKYMTEDASSKRFFVSYFTNYKMTDSRPVLEQYNELLGILERFTQHKMNMDESIQDSDKPKGNNDAGPSVVNVMEHNNSSGYNDNKGKRKHHDTKEIAKMIFYATYVSEAYFVENDDVAVWGCMVAVRLPDLKQKTLGEKGIEYIFVGYAKHSKAFRFYVIEHNDSVAINSIIESKDVIFDMHRDEISDQHFYRFNVEDDPKTFDEAMTSHDVTF